MCVPSKTLWPTLKSCKWGYLFFHRKRLEPRVLPWQQHRRCHSVYFVMHIAGAKFEEHCLNISRVMLDWMLCCFSGTTYDVITFNTKPLISPKRKKLCQKGKRRSSLLWKAFRTGSNYFLLHRRSSHKPISSQTKWSVPLKATLMNWLFRLFQYWTR